MDLHQNTKAIRKTNVYSDYSQLFTALTQYSVLWWRASEPSSPCYKQATKVRWGTGNDSSAKCWLPAGQWLTWLPFSFLYYRYVVSSASKPYYNITQCNAVSSYYHGRKEWAIDRLLCPFKAEQPWHQSSQHSSAIVIHCVFVVRN